VTRKKLDCPICPMSDLFTKKWLHFIVKYLDEKGALRYSELKKLLGGVSPKTLTERLRELENYGILTRTVYPEVPPRVEYELTEKGLDLSVAINYMCDWVTKWYSDELVIVH
jgi:DNA-binding HxlR family transcriptional regulator